MLNLMTVAIFAVFSQSVTSQHSDFFQYQKVSENSDENLYEENDLPYPDMVYDDNAWFDLQYKVAHLLDQVDYEEEDLEKFESARGIPQRKSNHMCYEKKHGPFPTTEEFNLPHEDVYPSQYYNISCLEESLHHHHHHHERYMGMNCEADSTHQCSTITQEVPVYKKTSYEHKKDCWKLVKRLTVENGCKCRSAYVNLN